MKIPVVILGICLSTVLGAPAINKKGTVHDAGMLLVQSVRDLGYVIANHDGTNFTDMKDQMSQVTFFTNALRELTSDLYRVNKTETKTPIQELEEIMMKTVLQHPEVILKLFEDQPFTVESVKILVLIRSLTIVGQNMEQSLANITDKGVVREIFRQTVEIQFGVTMLRGIISDVESRLSKATRAVHDKRPIKDKMSVSPQDDAYSYFDDAYQQPIDGYVEKVYPDNGLDDGRSDNGYLDDGYIDNGYIDNGYLDNKSPQDGRPEDVYLVDANTESEDISPENPDQNDALLDDGPIASVYPDDGPLDGYPEDAFPGYNHEDNSDSNEDDASYFPVRKTDFERILDILRRHHKENHDSNEDVSDFPYKKTDFQRMQDKLLEYLNQENQTNDRTIQNAEDISHYPYKKTDFQRMTDILLHDHNQENRTYDETTRNWLRYFNNDNQTYDQTTRNWLRYFNNDNQTNDRTTQTPNKENGSNFYYKKTDFQRMQDILLDYVKNNNQTNDRTTQNPNKQNGYNFYYKKTDFQRMQDILLDYIKNNNQTNDRTTPNWLRYFNTHQTYNKTTRHPNYTNNKNMTQQNKDTSYRYTTRRYNIEQTTRQNNNTYENITRRNDNIEGTTRRNNVNSSPFRYTTRNHNRNGDDSYTTRHQNNDNTPYTTRNNADDYYTTRNIDNTPYTTRNNADDSYTTRNINNTPYRLRNNNADKSYTTRRYNIEQYGFTNTVDSSESDESRELKKDSSYDDNDSAEKHRHHSDNSDSDESRELKKSGSYDDNDSAEKHRNRSDDDRSDSSESDAIILSRFYKKLYHI